MASIKCTHSKKCSSYKTDKCSICTHNKLRNYARDYFEKASDDKHEKSEAPKYSARRSGKNDDSVGYPCPVCGKYTYRHQLVDDVCCCHCGHQLIIK